MENTKKLVMVIMETTKAKAIAKINMAKKITTRKDTTKKLSAWIFREKD